MCVWVWVNVQGSWCMGDSIFRHRNPTENKTTGSRFDAQPIVEASCAGPAPLDRGAPAPRLVGIVSTEVPSDPHTPGDI